MDALSIMIAALISKSIPGTAGAAAAASASDASDSATAAAASAALAQAHSMGVTVSGTGIVFTDLTDETEEET